jgi:hypothetical protein
VLFEYLKPIGDVTKDYFPKHSHEPYPEVYWNIDIDKNEETFQVEIAGLNIPIPHSARLFDVSPRKRKEASALWSQSFLNFSIKML